MFIHLLKNSSTLLFAAYSVAVSAGDLEYLTEIVKDIASSLQTEQGRSACEAQDEVLQVCDQLYSMERITESQLLYLRHLTLIRDNTVANLYDEFQQHESVILLAKGLYELSNTHPFSNSPEDTANNDNNNNNHEKEDGNGNDEEDEGDNDEQEAAISKELSSGLINVLVLMAKAKIISKTEAQILMEMVQNEDECVFAAYELYTKDHKLDDLQDTLIRCVRLEIRKRVTEIQEREIENLQKETNEEENDEEEEEEEEGGDGNDNNDQDEEEDNEDEEGDNEEDDDDDDYEAGKAVRDNDLLDNYAFDLEDISLTSILSELQVENIWKNTVPETFIQTVFIAVLRRQLQLDHAKALCDLFHAKYDLVHAAWEVFVVQRDAIDFIDTLRRIVKDLDTNELQEISSTSATATSSVAGRHDRAAATMSSTTAAAAAAAAANTSTATTEPSTSSSAAGAPASSSSSSQQQPPMTYTTSSTITSENLAKAAHLDREYETAQRERQEAQDAKTKALRAIDEAKRDLLKHSLDMMVKQNLLSQSNAESLYERHLAGDKLTDAAIESYAADKDVNEFIDTLQLLASHSKEELDILLGTSMSNLQKEQEEEQQRSSKPAATASTGTAAATSTPASSTSSGPSSRPLPNSLADLALQQIEEIVQEMLKSDMISSGVATVFTKLIVDRDIRLIQAYETFLQNRNGTELIDTLLRIVIASVEGVAKASSTPATNTNNTTTTAASPSKSPATSQPTSSTTQGGIPSPHYPRSTSTATSPPKAPVVGSPSTTQTTNLTTTLLDADDQKTIVNILLE
jgi:hypothetical protein